MTNPRAAPYQRIDQFRLDPNYRGRPAWVCLAWLITQKSVFAWSPWFAFGWRNWLLRCFGADLAHHVGIRPGAVIKFPWKLRMGEWSSLADGVTVYNLGPVEIGAHCVISQNTYLCAGSHDVSRVEFPLLTSPIRIEDEVWIAADVFVHPGVTIGRGSVVGARSTVTRSLPAGQICAGSPARPIRPRLMEDSMQP